MKVSKAEAAANRYALLEAAGTLYREKGFDAVSIGEIATAAGVTHGGLYGHFASKDALRAEVLDGLFGWTARQVENATDLPAFLDLYLSRRHVGHPGAGCPLASLGSDTARADRETRDEFASGLEKLIEAFSALAATRTGTAARGDAIAAIASMVGAVVLARASGSKALGDEILADVRKKIATTLPGR